MTGDDVARIARSLHIMPWEFTAAVRCEEPSEHGFALDRSAKRYRLALLRTFTKKSPDPACTFLFRLRDGTARCGLGEGRPAPCKTFPLVVRGGAVSLEPAGCTCAWDDVELGEGDGNLLIDEHAARRRYREVVAAWNRYVADLEPPLRVKLHDFGRYLLETYPP